MDAAKSKDFQQVKQAILRRYSINEETYRQQFRNTKKKTDESYVETEVQLKDLSKKWLKPTERSKEDLVNIVIREEATTLAKEITSGVIPRPLAMGSASGTIQNTVCSARRNDERSRKDGRDGSGTTFRSDWACPVVMVPKKDGTRRFCVDFRKINSISKFDAYPMARIDDIINRPGRATYLSTIDLTRDYWQVPLSQESREKTAFTTPAGLYEFTTMPFRLHGAE